MDVKRKPLSDQIRAAINAAEMTRYRIAKDTGISESMLSRFMSGSRVLSMRTLDILGDYLGLEVRLPSRRTSQKVVQQLRTKSASSHSAKAVRHEPHEF